MVTGGRWGTVLERGRGILLCALLVTGGAILFRQDAARPSHTTSPAGPPVATSVLAKLPLAFEPNLGQSATPVRFLARSSGYALYLTSNEAVLALASRKSGSDRLGSSVVRMQFAGAASNVAPTAAESLPGRTNYILGNNPSRWLHNIPQFARVQYRDLYPGIGLDFYGNQGRLEYDFNVAPGADPKQIELKFEGADNLRIDAKGNLVLAAADREVQFEAPHVYQKTASGTQAVEGTFVLRSDHRVRFEIGNYDRSRTLVIDPVLTYSTYLGGSGVESCAAIAGAPFVANCPAITVDSAARVYIAGATTSTAGWPTPATGSANSINPLGGADVFVARISNSGSTLTLDYLTFIGGSSTDYPTGIAVDTGFDVYIAGNTSSSDFPTVNGLQSSATGNHGFVAKLDPTGSANVYSTYIAGSGVDSVSGMTLDKQARVYVFGTTTSQDLQTTPGALQSTPRATNQFYFLKLDPAQNGPNSKLYLSYIGGSNPTNGVVLGGAIAVDTNLNVYLAGGTTFADMPTVNAYQGSLQGGTDVWVGRLLAPTNNTQQYTLSFETYLGAAGDNSQVDIAYGVATDATNTYVTGSTTSNAFTLPVGIAPFQSSNAGGTDAFVARFGVPTAVGTTLGAAPLNYFSYLGGSANDAGLAIVADSTQNARVTGFTQSSNFPNTNPLSSGSGGTDAFYARIVTNLGTGSTNTSSTSILGGSGADIGTSVALDVPLNSYVAGETTSPDFPVAPSAGQSPIAPVQGTLSGASDAFLSKIGPSTVGLGFACPTGTTCPNSTQAVSPSPVGVGNSVAFTYPIFNTGDPVSGAVFTVNVNQLPNASANSSITGVTSGGGSCSESGTTAVCNLGTVPTSSQTSTTTGGVTTTTTAPALQVTVNVTATAPPSSGPTPSQPPAIGNTATLTIPGTNFQQTASLSAVVNDFGVQATPNTFTVTNGGTATYQLVVTPSGPIPSSISLGQCSGLPAGATCQFGPNPIPNLNNGAMTSTLSITTTPRVTTPASLFRNGPVYAFWFPVSGLALIGAGASRKRRLLMAILVVCVLGVVGLQAGCGSTSSSGSTTTGTPAGTYTVSMNATSGTATRTTSVTLIVK